mgnify:CR=1 FL=1
MFLKPKIKLHAITDITPDMLEKYGITALILDVDNTLSTHHGQKLTDGLENWLDIMKKNGIRLIILSNSKEKRVKPFAEKINLPYVSLGLKPLPFKFRRALRVKAAAVQVFRGAPPHRQPEKGYRHCGRPDIYRYVRR